MCAIAGILDLPYNESVISKMLATMARRGPDGNGVAMMRGVCLLHSRLAIIDPEGGQQPMKLQWKGKNYTIIYNGELYNTQEIRRELETLGHTFLGHSDTEVVLHAFAAWREDCLLRFNGIYAFAVWEREGEELFLARDRMGVKPLFYTQHRGGLLFSSEIKTLFCYESLKPELDETGAGEILLLGPGRTPGSGVLKDIRELEPGCCGWYRKGNLQLHRYWQLQDREFTDSFEETVEKVRYLVLDAIQRQMVSDVPIGTFLSGGLDSSLICSVCSREYARQGRTLPAFSLDFAHNDRYFTPGKFQPDSDNRYIEKMQQYLPLDHHWTVLQLEDQLSVLEEATIARDLPGMADVDFSLLLLCRDISDHVKVALSGECADEIFGGYPWYRDPQVRSKAGFPWAQNSNLRVMFLKRGILPHGEEFIRSHYEDTISQCHILDDCTQEDRQIKQMVNLNQRWFMQTLLDRKDRMSMYHSLEVRVPFCDHRIAEYLYTVPWKYKDHRGIEKGLLRQAMDGYLPESVLWRKKSPYPKTYDPRYRQLVADRLRRLLQRKDAPIFQLVEKKPMEDLLESDLTWPWYGQLMGTPQTIAFLLQINFWLENYNISLQF